MNKLGAFVRATRNISRRKMRALLVIIALSFSLAIMISIPAGVVANQQSAQSLTQNFSNTLNDTEAQINQTANLIECSTAGGGTFFGGALGTPPGFNESGGGGYGYYRQRQEFYMNESVVDSISSISGVAVAVPLLQVPSSETVEQIVATPRGEFTLSRPLYTINGVCLNSSTISDYSVLPTNITSGRNLHEGDTGVLLMSLNLSQYYGVNVGGQVDVNGTSFTVIGIYGQTGQGFATTRGVYMNLTDAQTVMDETGNVSRLDVYVQDASYVDSVNNQIQAMYVNEINAGEISVSTYSDRLTNLQNEETTYNQLVNSAESTVSQTQSLANEEVIVALVATSVIVLFVMLYTVRERTKEIGTLKAIGVSNWNVMSQFMIEGVILALVAGLVGIGIGTVGASALSSILLPAVNPFGSRSSGFRGGGPGFVATSGGAGSIFGSSAGSVAAVVTPTIMMLALGAAVLLGVVGSLYPAWRASRIKPAEAMRYE